MQQGHGGEGEELVVRRGEEVGEFLPPRLVEVSVAGRVDGGRGHGEEAACLLDLLRILGAEGDEPLFGVGDGL